MRGNQDPDARGSGRVIPFQRRGGQSRLRNSGVGHRGADGGGHRGRRSHRAGTEAVAGVAIGCLDAVGWRAFVVREAGGSAHGAGCGDGCGYAGHGGGDGEGGGGD